MSKGLFLTEGVSLSRGGFRVHCRKDALAPHDEHGVEKVVNGLCDVGLGSQFLPEPNQHQRPNDRVPVEVSHIALLSDASYLLACCLHRIVWRESLRGDRLRSRESQEPRDPAADSGKTLLAGVGSQLGMRHNAPNQKKRARGLGKPRARVAAIEVWVFGGGEQPLKRIVVELFLLHAFGATPTSSRHLKDTLETPQCRIHGKKYLCF